MILWIHVLAAIAWVGGMLFFLVVLAPLFRGTFPAREEIQIAYAAGRRYQFVAARAMEFLLLTGIWNIVARVWDAGGTLPPRFWSILGLKVVGFTLMVGLQTWQRIWMNRKLAPLIVAGGGGLPGEEEWRAIQSRLTAVTRLNLAMGVVVVFLALMLGRL
ncbi:MAG: CopD family protein [Candidatus Methylomirabilales bacterium]